MIAVIDYGVGNLFSLTASLAHVGADAVVTDRAEDLESAKKIILPGVGAFEPAIAALKETGLVPVLDRLVKEGKPLMGICLGMQLLFDKSYEYGEWPGLGYIGGEIVGMQGRVRGDLKIPQMGWNDLRIRKDDPLTQGIRAGDCVYFVHGYYATGCETSTIADVNYDVTVPAIVRSDNVCGTQFHPEKSGKIGLRILKNFVEG